MSVRLPRRTLLLTAALSMAAVPAARALDLPSALAQVAASAPGLAARAHEMQAARAHRAAAGAWSEPMLEAGVQNVPVSGRFDADMMTMRVLGVEQHVPLPGVRGARRAAAAHAWDASRAEASAARLEVLANAWEAYADAYYGEQLAAAAAGHAGEMTRMVDAARAREASGRARLDESLRAEAERARLGAEAAMLAADVTSARARLAALRGLEADDGAPLEAPPDSLAGADAPEWARGETASQPRVRALAATTARWRAEARAARRADWPDLDVRASYGWRATLEGGMKQDDLWSASVGLSLPLFAGARPSGAQAAELDQRTLAAASDERAATLDVRQQVSGAHAEAAAARRQAHVLADTVAVLQQRALSSAWAAYAAGSNDLAMVLDAAHALYSVQLEELRARQAFAHACAKLLLLTGDGALIGAPTLAPLLAETP